MPQTLRLRGDRAEDVERAAAILRNDGLVAFPTETVYGLGANALSAIAVAKIFAAKQRPAWDPLIVHLPDRAQVASITAASGSQAETIRILAAAFWPGPLTLLLPRGPVIPDEVTAGRSKVGVRVPSHPLARRLLEAAGVPVAAPSANRFGHVSPTTAEHVLADLDGRIDAVLDGGPTTVGVESTVLDPTERPMVLYRAGAVTLDMLRSLGLPMEVFAPDSREANDQLQPPGSLPSPGVGIRHYAPEAELVLSGPDQASLQREVEGRSLKDAGKIGVLLPSDWRLAAHTGLVEPWGTWTEPETLAAGLFAGLRALEHRGAAIILCPLPAPGGLRDALRDRLQKAARPRT